MGDALLRAEGRRLHAQTNDASLKAYESWDDFGHNLKHAGSLVNFVAAYGLHASIIAALTTADKRAAALKLVSDGENAANAGSDAWNFMHSQGIYANNVTSANAIHDAAGLPAKWSTGSITGVDQIDMWIAGLAEKQTLNGGLLGTTFDFIFRMQMEHLQDGDRLYYLPRVEGTHFADQIENPGS